MNRLKLNETPVRTSKSFNINNVKFSNVEIPKNIPDFNNVEIIGNTSKIKVENKKTPICLKFGIGEEYTEQVRQHSNQNYKLTIDAKTNKETVFNFNFDNKNNILVENIDILANEGTNSTVVIKYESKENMEFYHNGIIKIYAKENSVINIIVINMLNDMSNNFLALDNKIEEKANVNYTIVDFGGQNTVSNYYSNILGDFAQNNINTIYIGKNKQIIDLNYIAELYGKNSNIDIQVQGALKDKAKKHFKGTIDFKKGCKKAKGDENENCVLLSDTAKSIALPMLLCSEEDVDGSHSCSAGKIGDKELFYIMSRGFSLKEAQKLLVRANFNKILENIKNEELKQNVLNEIDKRLD